MKHQKYAIVGFPLKHSLSPFIHEKLFDISGMDATYEYMEIDECSFANRINDIKELSGANVTIPYKTEIISYLDKLDSRAKIYGAVNTILNQDGTYVGYNTDCFGFLRSLESENIALAGNIVVCGCGGVARMMSYECVMAKANLTIAVRKQSLKKAETLKSEILVKYPDSKIDISALDELDLDIDLLINGTPVGMFPNADGSPVADCVIERSKAVFDSIYNPEKTMLLKKADDFGVKIVGGMAMLVWQAVAAQEIWFNTSFKKDDVKKIIDSAKKELIRRF